MKLYKKASGIYAVEFQDDAGNRRRVTTGCRDRAEAQARARDIIIGGAGQPSYQRSAPVAGLTMRDLFERCQDTVWSRREGCRSLATVRSNVKILNSLIGDVAIGDMTYTRLAQLKDDLFARGYAPGTVKRKLDAVSRSLSVATEWELSTGKFVLASKPRTPRVTCDNARDRVISSAEEAAILAAVEGRIARFPSTDWRRFGHLFRFLMDTGCRLGEALRVTVGDLETRDDGVTYVTFPRYTTKNKRPRTLPLTDRIVETLEYLKATAIDGRIFPMSPGTAWYQFNAVRSEVTASGTDIDNVVLHSARHTCLTRLAKRLRIHVVSWWAGHSSIQITVDTYAHLSSEDMAGAHAILNGGTVVPFPETVAGPPERREVFDAVTALNAG